MGAGTASGEGMEKIDAQHVSEPGLMVLDITAGDEATVLAAMAELDRQWATSGTAPRRVPGEPGVTARLYADLRRHPPAKSEPMAQLCHLMRLDPRRPRTWLLWDGVEQLWRFVEHHAVVAPRSPADRRSASERGVRALVVAVVEEVGERGAAFALGRVAGGVGTLVGGCAVRSTFPFVHGGMAGCACASGRSRPARRPGSGSGSRCRCR